MTWQLWIIFGIFVVNAVLAPSMVGKERTPYTPVSASIVVLIDAILAALLITGAA